MKKQFITNVLFPSLQLINTYLFKLQYMSKRERVALYVLNEQIHCSDFTILSLLSSLEDSFGVIVDLFVELKGKENSKYKQQIIILN